jgi:hypothetical protein
MVLRQLDSHQQKRELDPGCPQMDQTPQCKSFKYKTHRRKQGVNCDYGQAMLFQMALSVKAKGKTNKRWSLVVYLGG